VAAVSGGTGNLESVTGGLGALTAESSWDTFNQGPVGFQAIGKITAAAAVVARVSGRPLAAPAARRGVARPRHRGRSRVAIAGAPASMRAGTSVQLSALLTGAVHGLRWRVSAGSITAGGLYTAPGTPPRGGRVVLSADGPRGARDRRTIEITPVSAPRPAPAALLAAGSEGASGGGLAVGLVPAPRAVLAGDYLVLTGDSRAPGRLTLTAEHAGHRLGSCTVSTPADRDVSCVLTVIGVAPHMPIGVSASLQAAGATFTSSRAPAPIPAMKD
jgi:hypothetical protein